MPSDLRVEMYSGDISSLSWDECSTILLASTVALSAAAGRRINQQIQCCNTDFMISFDSNLCSSLAVLLTDLL